MTKAQALIGAGIRIQGDLSGSGDLVVEGQVDGSIQIEGHLAVEPMGVVRATISAARVTILGRASGDIEAEQRVEVRAGASLSGDVRAPSVVIEEGATFSGTIQMDVGIPEDL